MIKEVPLIFEKSVPGRQGVKTLSTGNGSQIARDMLPADMLRTEPLVIPEIGEVDVVRHFTALSKKNYGLDDGFYPLGSCTMKHNPKINELLARLPGFTDLHPEQPDDSVQGALQLMFELQEMLAEITGMDAFSLSPAAGAHGEQTGLLMLKAYHESRGESQRNCVIVPDSAHGTNPASATVTGFEVVQVSSAPDGTVDLEQLRAVVTGPLRHRIAGLMLTNPNTLGLFETRIHDIAAIVHESGGLLYYDGANLNAVMGITRPGDMGFDIIHLNLHKTFSTPHGGGGPGAGPVGVKSGLANFLPSPAITRTKESERDAYTYRRVSAGPASIGRVREFYGNFGVLVRAYCYILTMGAEGLTQAAKIAVLNANYLRCRLNGLFNVPFDRTCMHEFVLAGIKTEDNAAARQGITLNIAKRMLDFGIHPPTIYFPLIVPEAMMIEPTETESPETLDAFVEILRQIRQESLDDPALHSKAPYLTPVRRIDEVRAARHPVLRWTPEQQGMKL